MKECSICRCDENETELKNFDCDICKTDLWFVCNECDKKIKTKFDRCPMCRSNLKEIDIKVELNSDSDSDSDSEIQNNTTQSNMFNINVDTILKIFFVFLVFLANIFILFIFVGIYMLICDQKCISCYILAFLCGLLNYMLGCLFFFGYEIEAVRIITSILVFTNGIYIFILSGIRYHCEYPMQYSEKEYTQHSEEEYCSCIFVVDLIYVPMIACLLSCCICSKNED